MATTKMVARSSASTSSGGEGPRPSASSSAQRRATRKIGNRRRRGRVVRRNDCVFLMVAWGVVYLLGVQWGMQLMAYQHRGAAGGGEGGHLTILTVGDSLDIWKSVWESYLEPIFETVYDYDDDVYDDDGGIGDAIGEDGNLDPLKRKTKVKKRRKRQQKEPPEPEPVLFTAPETLKLPKPIINVGFPKAGTSSIFSFFHCNGLKGQHWFCCEPQNHPSNTPTKMLMSRCILDNVRAKYYENETTRQIFDGCGDYDFYSEINGPRMFKDSHYRLLHEDGRLDSKIHTQRFPRMIIPQHHYLAEIHQDYPDATFVLNTRPTDAWVQSVLNWGTTLRYELPNEFLAQDRERGFTMFHDANRTLIQAPPRNMPELNATLAYIIDRHHDFIRSFVKEHPSHALIEVYITDPDAGTILADAFGLNETCWGHKNQNRNIADGRPEGSGGNASSRTAGGRMAKVESFIENQQLRNQKMRERLAQQVRSNINESDGSWFGSAWRLLGGQSLWDRMIGGRGDEEEMDEETALAAVTTIHELETLRMERQQQQGPLKETTRSSRRRDQRIGEGHCIGRCRQQQQEGKEDEAFELEQHSVGENGREARKTRNNLYQRGMHQHQQIQRRHEEIQE